MRASTSESSKMPPTHPHDSDLKTPALEGNGFEEPTISDPMDLAKTGAQAPLMAMIGAGSGGGGVDAGGFPPDGGADGSLDGGAGPGSDGGGGD